MRRPGGSITDLERASDRHGRAFGTPVGYTGGVGEQLTYPRFVCCTWEMAQSDLRIRKVTRGLSRG